MNALFELLAPKLPAELRRALKSDILFAPPASAEAMFSDYTALLLLLQKKEEFWVPLNLSRWRLAWGTDNLLLVSL